MKLVADRISHAYGALPVLEDVSLEAGEGEIVAIVGPSGSGKSTLLRILGGLERPSQGAALIEGAARADSLNPITYVFQDFALLPWRSVADNVALPLEDRVADARLRDEMVREALARLGLADFANAYPRQLSGGMKQRVGLARALVVRPSALLLDEPLSALDAQTRDLLMDDLRALLSNAPFAGLYVTHNLDEAVLLARRVVVLSRRPGRVRAIFEIERPPAERRIDQADILTMRAKIWDCLRDDAAAAVRELDHV